jgi:hypothetical protein
MKNIHVLPTDKPSRLYFNHNKGFEKYQFSKEPFINGLTNTTNQHIYITSDEEIKEDDWGLSKLNEVILFGRSYNEKFYKKIILTTDQDLIKDGIQSIDDEFLEWFVKNQSCESVEVESMVNMIQFTPREFIYKIVIPQEEPKIELYMPKYTIGNEPTNEQEEPKQETVEEAAEKYAEEENSCYTNDYYGFIKGAKWQAERMYSEEDFKLFARQYYREIKLDKSNLLWDDLADKCFEQFKKQK